MAVYLVTGAAGFIGSHLAACLAERGDRVIGIDNFDPFYERDLKEANLATIDQTAFELAEVDVCDTDAVRRICEQHRPAAVLHIAALAGVRPSLREPERYTHVNVTGLTSVLEGARRAGCDRFVFASSSSVYGNRTRVPFKEDDPVDDPISPYAATKRAGELMCEMYHHLYGFTIASLRFFTVYGPAQRPDLAIASFMSRLVRGETLPMFGDGSTSRDYTFITDIGAGVLAALERVERATEPFHRIYNLGGSHPITLAEMIASIGEVVGREPRIERLPMQPGDVERTYADLSRSAAELGYQPSVPFREGLAAQWAWLQRRPATS